MQHYSVVQTLTEELKPNFTNKITNKGTDKGILHRNNIHSILIMNN